MGLYMAGNFQTITNTINCNQIFSNFSCIFVSITFRQFLLQIFEILILSNNMKIWNLNMGINGKIIQFWISEKYWLYRVKRMTSWYSGVLMTTLWGTFYVKSFNFSLEPFQNFPMLRFSKGYCSHSFHPISSKRYGKYGNSFKKCTTLLKTASN